MQKVEVMAPVGSFASLAAAINAGAGSVYFGIEQLNMRARASDNFTTEDLVKIVETAEPAGVKTYLTMNTILYQHDMNQMQRIMDAAKAANVTAAIVADVAALQYANQIGLVAHGSTQLSISNMQAVKFYAQFCDTVVLAREVDLKTMKHITKTIQKEQIKGPNGELVKVEIFVHGALCIAQSGRCHMSILQTNTSAQRGACLQECRKKYRVIDEDSGREMRVENEYILSPKDLCCIDFLDKIIGAGVSILKIEGRGRSAQYVDTVVQCYREAVEAIEDGTYGPAKIEDWLTRLKKVYNRGFTDGYYLGKPLPDWSGTPGNRSEEQRVFAGLITHYFPKAKVAELQLQAHPLEVGDKLVIMGNTTGVAYADVTELRDDTDKPVESVKHPHSITIPCPDKVRPNDKVYILRKRELSETN